MSKLIIDVLTGETIERELNSEEIAQQVIDEANIQSAQAILQAEADARTAQRQAVLNRLGITEEEARILLGGN